MKRLILLAFFLLGCAPRVVYKDVFVPTPCNVQKPSRPHKDLGVLEYVRALLIYTESLEKDLDFCTKPPKIKP
ncbi:hypothetical protein [Helicobacter sp. L8]|uniref:hypothetical protein n=1 Tax=Helicobacter sp. L8 TaxID=2316078 RepID=UPI000EB3D33C|nr:hypothetical protein [Helicobacter sp. L8]